ncbi:peptidase S24 [Chryseobacterium sp. T20]|uniref:peptidase S24 n=1 Tax=Chryseobacterium sp. T20 TaxID=3395375 RepID=UPI0039BD50F6
MKNKNVKERILVFIKYKGLNKSQFYKNTGLSNGFLDKVNDIGISKGAKILQAYPNINPEWLFTGNGEMLINKQESKQEYEILTDQYCIDFLKKTGKYKILKIDYTEI